MSVFSDRAIADYKGTRGNSSPSLRVVSPPSSPLVGVGAFGGVFVVVFLFLLISALVGALAGSEPKTFYDFLLMLQSAPVVSTDWLSFESITVAFPEWLEWFAPFIEFFEGIVRVGGFLVTGVVQALTFVLHFLTWVFI